MLLPGRLPCDTTAEVLRMLLPGRLRSVVRVELVDIVRHTIRFITARTVAG